MSFPQTLAGITGFLLFVAMMVGMIIPTLSSTSSQLTDAELNFRNSLNSSVNSTDTGETSGFWGFVGEVTGVGGVYDFIIAAFQIQIAFVQYMLAYIGIYVDIMGTVPAPFYVLFVILADSLIVGIIKLMFLSGD